MLCSGSLYFTSNACGLRTGAGGPLVAVTRGEWSHSRALMSVHQYSTVQHSNSVAGVCAHAARAVFALDAAAPHKLTQTLLLDDRFGGARAAPAAQDRAVVRESRAPRALPAARAADAQLGVGRAEVGRLHRVHDVAPREPTLGGHEAQRGTTAGAAARTRGARAARRRLVDAEPVVEANGRIAPASGPAVQLRVVRRAPRDAQAPARPEFHAHSRVVAIFQERSDDAEVAHCPPAHFYLTDRNRLAITSSHSIVSYSTPQ